MVAEVEIRNTVESIKLGSAYPAYVSNPEFPMLSGYLTNQGQTLNIEVNREIASNCVRVAYLFFGVVDFNSRTIDYKILATSDPTLWATYGDNFAGTSYTWDISSVLTIPRSVPEITSITDITIDIFTYEANVTNSTGTAIYGKKQLNVPYKIVSDPSVTYPKSTDGWYPIGVMDYAYVDISEVNTRTFYKNDLVWWYDSNEVDNPNGSLYLTSEDTTLRPDAVGSPWILATSNDVLNFMMIPQSSSLTSATAIIGANAMITRYAKQSYIKDLLLRTSFKPNDDRRATYALLNALALRESVVAELEAGDMVRSVYYLDQIAYQKDAMFSPNNSITLTQVNSTYTV